MKHNISDLKLAETGKDASLTIQWEDGTTSSYLLDDAPKSVLTACVYYALSDDDISDRLQRVLTERAMKKLQSQ